jgi:hypothetical protein
MVEELMGISAWSTWDTKPLTSDCTREADIIKRYSLENALSVLDSVLRPPTVVNFYGTEISVTDNNIYTDIKSGNAYVQICKLAKATGKKVIVHDVVKEG